MTGSGSFGKFPYTPCCKHPLGNTNLGTIGASNFFKLAVATATSLFGIESLAALATVVGVLIEVPVMLSVVYIVNRTRPW